MDANLTNAKTISKIWIAFRRSLKDIEAEELLDLYIFRPLGLIVVLLVKPFPVTPNQISIISMLFGIIAGVLVAYNHLCLAATMLILTNILDCADGQLARLKGNGTPFGRIIDGAIDYVVYTAVYVGMMFYLVKYGEPWLGYYAIPIIILMGIANAVQTATLDYHRHRFLAAKKGTKYKDVSLDALLSEYSELKKEKGFSISRLWLHLYLTYTNLQGKFSRTDSTLAITTKDKDYREAFVKKQRGMLRLWTFIGPSAHMTLLIVFLYAGRVMYYIWAILGVMMLIWLVLFIIQKVFYSTRLV